MWSDVDVLADAEQEVIPAGGLIDPMPQMLISVFSKRFITEIYMVNPFLKRQW